MIEYLIKGETLTALADEIRTLTEGTEKLGPDAMTTSVNGANADIAEQLELINEIIDILRYKGGTLAELLSPATAEDLLEGKQLLDGDGNRVTGTMPNNGELVLTMDGIDTTSVEIPAGYASGGTVSLDNTISDEVDEQTGLIAEILNTANNLPEAYKTCTVELVGEPFTIVCSAIDADGDLTTIITTPQQNSSLLCLCNAFVVIHSMDLIQYANAEEVTVLGGTKIVNLTAEPGGQVTITGTSSSID